MPRSSSNTAVRRRQGTITVETGPGPGARRIEGSPRQRKVDDPRHGHDVGRDGQLHAGQKGSLQTTITSASNFGKLSVTGASSITGKLTMKQGKTFKGADHESFALLSSSALTGTFSVLKGEKVKKSTLVFVPTYSGTGAALVIS